MTGCSHKDEGGENCRGEAVEFWAAGPVVEGYCGLHLIEPASWVMRDAGWAGPLSAGDAAAWAVQQS
jgi:hypothetical protein